MQQNRTGETKITSASLSKDFADMMQEFNMSPTEVMRKGIAVTLFDMGVSKYQTEVNKERSKFVKKFFEEIKEDESRQKEFDMLIQIAESILYYKKYCTKD